MSSIIQETLYTDFGMCFKNEETIYKEKTSCQDLMIFRNKFFGKVMMLDGATQLTNADEFIYHEMMAHVPLFSLQNPKTVLIIGGGDGGIAREVMKHSSIEKCIEVEIDRAVVDFSLKHFPEVSNGAYSDSRFELIITDGAKFVEETDLLFDVIIVDSTDPDGPGSVLFTKEFYSGCKRCLKPDGILVTQNGVPFFQGTELTRSVSFFKELFLFGSCYLAAIPTYIGGHMAMGFATNNLEVSKNNLELLTERFKSSSIVTNYYNSEIHLAAFALPNFIKNSLS